MSQNSSFKEMAENPIPLSPQWLLPKQGPDVTKSPSNGNALKKNDVFRPTFMDSPDSARRDRDPDRDRWRDEERDTLTVNGPKNENRSVRHFGDPRRRAGDPARENNSDQRRESKWNTRWGPDDKRVERWSDGYEKGKDEGDHVRPWRPSSLQGRGKADQTTKEGPTFGHGHGRGRGESGSPFSAGRVRVNYGSGIDSGGDSGYGEASPFRYSRTKLLDVYRVTDLSLSSNKILDGLMQVPSLTQEQALEPLALVAPTPEESAIFKGIDKGEIVSSGAPQVCKDGSTGRNANDFSQTRRIKHGSRDDTSLPLDDGNDKIDPTKSTISESLPHEKQIHAYGSDGTMNKNENIQIYGDNKIRVPAGRDNDTDSRDSGTQGRIYTQSATPWRSPSVEQLANAQSRDTPNHIRSRSSDISWSQPPKDNSLEMGNVLPDPSFTPNELKHPVVDQEDESRKSYSSPEDLVLYYKDPQGQIQGPFRGGDIIGWFEAGYFGIDLQVRLANASNNSPFYLLGDVMPHLRAKARPPPGFNSAKQTEVPDVSSRSPLNGFGKVLPGPSGISLLGNEHRHTPSSSTEAENRFLESLMSADVSSSLQEGLQGFVAQTSNSLSPLGTESGEALNLLAQRLNLERQKSFTNPYSYWPTRDGAPIPSSPDITRTSNVQQANVLPPVGDIPRQSLPQIQNSDMMSILQGLSDRSSGGINNGLGVWPNFPLQSGIEGQNFPPQVAYGMQQHKLQQQNPPSLTNLLAQQNLETPTILPEKILSSGLTQDPQLLNLLHQQILLQQLQPQQSGPAPQLSLLDKLLLIKQQQKQEEQQLLLRQQQHLLSQVLSEQQLAQRFGDLGLGQLQPSSVGNSAIDQSAPHLSPSVSPLNSQTLVSSMPDDKIPGIANVPLKVPLSESSSLQLPHQMLGTLQQNFPSMSAHADIHKNNNLSSLSQMMENLPTSEALEKPQSGVEVLNSTLEFSAPSLAAQEMPTSVVDKGQIVSSSDSVPLELPESFVGPQDNESSNLESANDAKLVPTGSLEDTSMKVCYEEAPEVREVKKTSEKKSRKTKSSKAQPSPEQSKSTSKGSTKKTKPSESDGASVADNSEVSITTEAILDRKLSEPENDISTSPNLQSDVLTQQSVHPNSAQRAWKPAVSVKPKSLLEIQEEEQKKAQMEISSSSVPTSVSSLSSPTPWGGVLTHGDLQGNATNEHNKIVSSKSKKSGLHDLLAAEVLAKSRSVEVNNSFSSLPPLPMAISQQEVVDDENFIEAKDTKKSRKKSAKAKGTTGTKVSGTVLSTELTIASSPVEKGRSSKNVQVVKEVLPAPPSGPSLGDFVPWKGESTSPSPAPAWSTDSGKYPRTTSLRDILKEQEKKVTSAQQYSPITTPQKTQSSSARPVSAFSPSKGSTQISSELKSKGEDDLFWGPPDQIKQDAKQAVFPQLGNQGNWANKGTPSKGASINRQKSSGGRAVENFVLSPPPSSQVAFKGKRDGSTKLLEAMDFRDWCESESVRLTGSKDTSFLEFCSKQSKSEAQTLLIENLGSFDPNHSFIEKFLNYMEMLSADVLELAFQSRNDLKASYDFGANDMNSDNLEREDVASGNGSIKGKKKGKKGKKVSPSVLGFNVVSNRIMMGEIQTVED